MCVIIQKARGKGDDFILDLTCQNTGKPITIANDYGMYCDSRCGECIDIVEQSRSRRKINNVIDSVEW